MARLMIVDDERSVRELIARFTETLGHEGVAFATGRSALEAFDATQPDLLVVDLRIGDMDGLEVIRTCKARRPGLPVIMITAHGSVESAVEAMRLGAYDYLTKPFELDDLGRTIQAALAAGPAAAPLAPWPGGAAAAGVVGRSEAVRKIQLLIDRIAGRPVNVVFEGEYGVGKTSFARQLHAAGPSALHPFRTLHCSALPEALLEQEFIGGDGVRSAFERAAGGTLVLEEVDSLPLRMQAILCDQLAVDSPQRPFRVVGTTTRALDELVRKNAFRADLFYKLSVIPVMVPALRDRPEDIIPLAEHFLGLLLAKVSAGPRKIDKDARKLLQKYPWPGNVGELDNSIQRACALAGGPEITPAELPARLRQPVPPVPGTGEPREDALPVGTTLGRFVRDQERRFIKATLASVGGHKEQAAGVLGISLATLYRKLDE